VGLTRGWARCLSRSHTMQRSRLRSASRLRGEGRSPMASYRFELPLMTSPCLSHCLSLSCLLGDAFTCIALSGCGRTTDATRSARRGKSAAVSSRRRRAGSCHRRRRPMTTMLCSRTRMRAVASPARRSRWSSVRRCR